MGWGMCFGSLGMGPQTAPSPLPPQVCLMDALALFSVVLDQACSVPIVAHTPCQCWHSISGGVGGLCHRAGDARAVPHCGLGQLLGKSQETSKSPRLPQLFLCLISACACSSRVQFQFLILLLPVPLVFRAVNGDSPSSRPYSSGLWFQHLIPQGGHSVYVILSSVCPHRSAYPYLISSLLFLPDS